MLRRSCCFTLFAFGALSCAGAQTPTSAPSLSPHERETAIELGRALQRRAPLLEASEGGSYRLVHVTRGRGPRVHVDADVSALVLSGEVRFWLGNEACLDADEGYCELSVRELDAGESIDIECGTLYLVESDEPYGSSVFFVFESDPTALPETALDAPLTLVRPTLH